MAQTATPQHGDVLTMIHTLAKIERAEWPARSAALTASGVPRNEGEPGGGEPDPAGAGEPDPTGGGEPDPAGGEGEPSGAGREDEIRKLRRESAKYRTEAKKLREADEARKVGELSEIDREKAARKTAEEKATRLEREVLQAKIARKHKLDDDLVEFVVGDDEESMNEKAALLASKTTPGAPTPRVPAVPGGSQGSGTDGSTITGAKARELAAKNPAEFNRLVDAGEITAAALQGK